MHRIFHFKLNVSLKTSACYTDNDEVRVYRVVAGLFPRLVYIIRSDLARRYSTRTATMDWSLLTSSMSLSYTLDFLHLVISIATMLVLEIFSISLLEITHDALLFFMLK